MPWFDVKASQYGTIIVNGYAYPFINQQIMEQWSSDLTYVSVFSYTFDRNGSLIPLNDDRVIQTAYNNGVAPLMVVAPLNAEGQFSSELASAVLKNVVARDRLVNNIVNKLIEKDYYGVDFDFEYVYAEDKEDYIVLVSKTAARLNALGALTAVSLAPKTYAEQPGLLYGGHDYPGLGEAANLVLLMTYEWGYTYGPPMAVAPINKVREVLDYGVSVIPNNKILMGIPNYGYDWTLTFVPGESVAENISNVEAVERAASVGAEIQFDEVAQSPFYEYTDDQGLEHIVWFEDERSMRAKLELVNEYGLAGVSFWTIMDPFPVGSEVLNEMYTVAKVE